MDQNYYFTSIFQYPALCEPHSLYKCLLNKGLQSIKHLWKWHCFLTLFPLTFCTYYIFRHLMMFLPHTLRDFDKHWHGQDWDKVTECMSLFETTSFVSPQFEELLPIEFIRFSLEGEELFVSLDYTFYSVIKLVGCQKHFFPEKNNLFLMCTLNNINGNKEKNCECYLLL